LYANTVLPGMRTRHRGRIINVASMQAIPIMSAYVVSKTAIIRFSEALALDTVEDGIQVFVIHPRTVRTPMNEYVRDSPEVAKSAPGLQQWFQNLYAQGFDTPIERSLQKKAKKLCCEDRSSSKRKSGLIRKPGSFRPGTE
ncbi:MAG: SDR family oxidoreductase, partial [Verrucomicrobia bacterium]|nr:SDR family oxidoreductase [Verrucomicrobiota bacterium]